MRGETFGRESTYEKIIVDDADGMMGMPSPVLESCLDGDGGKWGKSRVREGDL